MRCTTKLCWKLFLYRLYIYKLIRQLKTIHWDIIFLFVYIKKWIFEYVKRLFLLHFPFLFTSVSAFWFQSLAANRWNVNMGMWQLCVWMKIFENIPLWLWVKNKNSPFQNRKYTSKKIFLLHRSAIFKYIYFFKNPNLSK